MTRTVLLVDDEMRIRRMIADYLDQTGMYTILEAGDGEEALRHMGEQHVDLVVLDLMMPRLNGEGFIHAVRQTSDVYILVLTARTGEEEHVYHYALGADDYVEKPFSIKALASKIAAVCSRLEASRPNGRTVRRADGVVLDESARELTVESEKKELKPKEFELLKFLMLNRNLVLSRERILNEVWGLDYEGSDRTVDIHISNVRKKLGPYQGYIQTVAGCGYKFEAKR